MTSFDQALPCWLQHLEIERGCSPNTISRYEQGVWGRPPTVAVRALVAILECPTGTAKTGPSGAFRPTWGAQKGEILASRPTTLSLNQSSNSPPPPCYWPRNKKRAPTHTGSSFGLRSPHPPIVQTTAPAPSLPDHPRPSYPLAPTPFAADPRMPPCSPSTFAGRRHHDWARSKPARIPARTRRVSCFKREPSVATLGYSHCHVSRQSMVPSTRNTSDEPAARSWQ
jgi:hypothetical protein